jgi:hypothetical protein
MKRIEWQDEFKTEDGNEAQVLALEDRSVEVQTSDGDIFRMTPEQVREMVECLGGSLP